MKQNVACEKLAQETIRSIGTGNLFDIVLFRINMAYVIGYENGCKRSGGREIPIVQLTKEEKIIKYWPSISLAARNLGMDGTHIMKVCQGKYGYKTAKGFKWKYYKDLNNENLLCKKRRPQNG